MNNLAVRDPRAKRPGLFRSTLLLCGAGSLLVLGGPALAASTASAANTKATTTAKVNLSGVTVRFGDIEEGSQLALEAAHLINTPYKIVWSEFSTGTQSFEAMSANQVDEISVGEETPLVAQASGLNFKILSVAGPANPNTPNRNTSSTAIIVPKGSPITSISQLAGKKIGYTPGSFTQYLLYRTLVKAGVSTTDFTGVPLSTTAETAAFLTGQLDALSVAGTPWYSLVVNDGARVLQYSNGLTTNLAFTIANPTSLQNKLEADALKDLASRISKAKAYLATHTKQWATLTASLDQVSPQVANYAVQFDHTVPYTTKALWTEAEKQQQREATTILNLGIITTPIQVASTFDPPAGE
jgi:sulfonate transport system substrate-binding protein